MIVMTKVVLQRASLREDEEESGEEGEVGFYFLSDLENKHKYISFSFSNTFHFVLDFYFTSHVF